MVGVPRSQGCRHCKRKKKGCDLGRPACKNCFRLSLNCTYDERRYTFIDESSRNSANNPIVVHQVLTVAQSAEPLHHRSFSRKAFELQTDEAFWSYYLPRDDPRSAEGSPRGVTAAAWLTTVRELAFQDQTTRFALDACVFMCLGRIQDNQIFIHQGAELYARALRTTNLALQSATHAQSDGVLASCKVLALYEIFRPDVNPISSQGGDWQRHIEGICRIVELRGPERHIARHGHALFEDARVSATTAGITKRTPNFFANISWYTVPWETTSRNLRDELYDTMIAVPSLLQRNDSLLRLLAQDDRDLDHLFLKSRELIIDFIALGEHFQMWEYQAVSQIDDSLDFTNIDPTLTNTSYALFAASRSHGHTFFTVTATFWAACVLVYSQARLTHSRLAAYFPTQLQSLPNWMNPQTFASYTAGTASHFFRPEAGLWGAQQALFPIGASMHYYAVTGQHSHPDMQALRGILKETRYAMFTSGFLKSIAAVTAPKTARGDCSVESEHSRMAKAWYSKDSE